MHSFKTWLTEEADTSYEGRTPHHIYHTEHGHLIHVHLDKDEHGTHAVFINKHLGGIVKTVSWKPDSEQPTKHELEKASAYEPEEEDAHLKESIRSFKGMLSEKAPAPVIEKPAKPLKEKKTLPPSIDLTNLTIYREMFPKGLLPSGQAARVPIKELEKKMTWFFENYKYDWEVANR